MPRRIKPIKPITTLRRLEALSPPQRKTYSRTLHARRLVQNAGMSREQAAREAGTTPGTMSRYLGDAVSKRGSARGKRGGRFRAAPTSRLRSYVEVPTTSGMRSLPATSREADLARRYRDALRHYGYTGDDSDLISLDGESIDGHTLLTDSVEIDELIARGELDPRDVGSGETGRR